MPLVDGYIFGVATATNKGAYGIANLPSARIGSALFNYTRHFETRNLTGRVGAVAAPALVNITAIDAGGPDPNQNLPTHGLRSRTFLELEHSRIARTRYNDCFHPLITRIQRVWSKNRTKTQRKRSCPKDDKLQPVCPSPRRLPQTQPPLSANN